MSIAQLDHYQFVRVSGPDSLPFLQGQLSCNVDNLTAQLSLRGALCNLKGRVIADFRLVLDAGDCLLQTQHGTAQLIVETLAKYAVFSNVQISIDSDHLSPLGVMGAESAELLAGTLGNCPTLDDQLINSDGVRVIKIADTESRYELWFTGDECKGSDYPATTKKLLDSVASASNADWERRDIAVGVVHITPKLSDSFTPQLLNYDISGVINFDKGCYTGQEVVARMYYRGKAKKRLFLLASDNCIEADASVIQTYGDKATSADIIAFSNTSNSNEGPNLLLAVLSTKGVATAGKILLSTNSQSPLQLLSLPYA
jgi:folate-binding protein YgfZ